MSFSYLSFIIFPFSSSSSSPSGELENDFGFRLQSYALFVASAILKTSDFGPSKAHFLYLFLGKKSVFRNFEA
jgi:hypothetical protein